MNINQLLSEIMKLDRKKRLELLNQLKELTQQKESAPNESKSPMLTELSGLGSEMWQDEDIDAYVEKERQWD